MGASGPGAAPSLASEFQVTALTERAIQRAKSVGARHDLALRNEIVQLAEEQTRAYEARVSQSPRWQSLDEAARAEDLLAHRRTVVADAVERTSAGLHQRLQDLHGELAMLGHVTDGQLAGQVGNASHLIQAEVATLEGALADLEALRGGRGSDPPYHPRQARQQLEAGDPAAIESGTMPDHGAKNTHLAGKRHPVSGIPFDERGFPIFDDVAAFDTQIRSDAASVPNPARHMRAATRELRDAIKRGEVSRDLFTAEQLKAISAGEAKIPDYTWHHHQQRGRMQLVPEDFHATTGHTGGMELWFR